MKQMKTHLQGNLCSCGGVWFNVALPESEPTFCPFCARKIDTDGELDSDTANIIDNDISNDDARSRAISKATGQDELSLVSKICSFCTNEILFDKNDAHNAMNCPYCNSELLSLDEYDTPEQTGSDMFSESINQMAGKQVSIKFKSINPFKKEELWIFGGMDMMSGMVKLIKNNGTVIWRHVTDMKSFTIAKNHEEYPK